jgi:phosphoglycerol transferase
MSVDTEQALVVADSEEVDFSPLESETTAEPAEGVVDREVWCRRPSGPVRWMLIDLGILTAIVGTALVWLLDLIPKSLRDPLGYESGDVLGVASSAQTIIETGWVQETSRLGAPYGLELYDYPVGGDNAHYLMMKVMSWVTGDWVLILNVFFLLTFFTAAWSSYLCQRWVGAGRVAAIVTSTLFAFAPFHLLRGLGHLMLASYFVVPVGVLLAVKAGSAASESGRAMHPRDRIAQMIPWILLCALVGSCGAYYAIFGVVVIVIASLLIAVSHRVWAPIQRGALFAAGITVTFIINVMPSVLYQQREGVNPLVAQRTPIELDIYGLRLIQMLTPIPGHWFGPLADVSADLLVGYPSETSQFLGLVAACGLVWMLSWLAVRLLRARTDADPVRSLLAAITLILILVGTTGGLAWLLTLVGFIEIRAWNRLSIVVAFTSLTWLALTVGPLARRWASGRPHRRWIAYGAAALVVVGGLADQASFSRPRDPDAINAEFDADRAFFSKVESLLPRGAMVYQLPYVRFPEEPARFASGQYDLLRPYLHSRHLRWSYGGMKGRDAEWQENITNLDKDDLLDALNAVGFLGLVIDTYAYEDVGVATVAEFGQLLDAQPFRSIDGRWVFFDLSDLRSRYSQGELDSLRERTLEHTAVTYEGCWPAEGEEADRFRWCGGVVKAAIARSNADGDHGRFSFIAVAPGGVGTLTVAIGGEQRNFVLDDTRRRISVDAPAGSSEITIRADVPATTAPGETRDLRFQLVAPQFTAGDS